MSDLANVLRAVLDRLGDFFDILDLSFFVAGATALAAMALFYHLAPLHFLDGTLGGAYLAGAGTLACYVLGLLAFSLGRALRRLLSRRDRLEPLLARALEENGLGGFAPYRDAKGRVAHPARLYTRLWVELRETPALATSFRLCKRFWVLNATFDGLTISLFIWWAVAAWAWLYRSGPHSVATRALGLALLSVVFAATVMTALSEARRYYHNQLEEVVATLAFRDQHAAAVIPYPAAGDARE
jgi:hypothetical protein